MRAGIFPYGFRSNRQTKPGHFPDEWTNPLFELSRLFLTMAWTSLIIGLLDLCWTIRKGFQRLGEMVPIILPGLVWVWRQTWNFYSLIKVWPKISHIKGGRDPIISREVNLLCIRANLLQNLKGAIGPWHDLGLTFAWKPFLSHMDPHPSLPVGNRPPSCAYWLVTWLGSWLCQFFLELGHEVPWSPWLSFWPPNSIWWA